LNNVIFIIVDSVFSDCLGRGRTDESSTPFIDSIIKDSLIARNVFSFGTYTDAATKGLLCGNRTLDDYGYQFSINSSDYNHYRLFKENGYETFGLYYPYYLIGPKVEQYIDHSIFTSGFIYGSVWFGKLKYYSEKNALTDTDYIVLEMTVKLMFECWLLFYKNAENVESRKIIFRIKDNNKDGYPLLLEEYECFEKGKKQYIDEMLRLGMEHPLAQINDYDIDRIVDKDFVLSIFKKYRSFFSEVEKKEFFLNLKNNHINIGMLFGGLRGLVDDKYNEEFRLVASWIMSIFGSRFMRHASQRQMWQPEVSMMTQINAILSSLDKRDNSEIPFFVSMHTEEPHNRIAYFTYDQDDEKLVNEELNYLLPLVEKPGKQFRGHLTYQLSLRYVDLGIKRLFEGLEKRNLLSDTTVLITADHGSSYTLYPLRGTVTNNFFIENYKVPLLIWKKNNKMAGLYDGMYQSCDILPTLCDVVGIESKEVFSGESIIDLPSGRDFVITEYMGPGCPDMMERDAWMSVIDRNYLVAIRAKLNSKIGLEDIDEIYDLIIDPEQLVNIVDKMRFDKHIERLFVPLKKRFDEIGSGILSIKDNMDKLLNE
jgi:arylsulfatase A-like enzyme